MQQQAGPLLKNLVRSLSAAPPPPPPSRSAALPRVIGDFAPPAAQARAPSDVPAPAAQAEWYSTLFREEIESLRGERDVGTADATATASPAPVAARDVEESDDDDYRSDDDEGGGVTYSIIDHAAPGTGGDDAAGHLRAFRLAAVRAGQ